MTQVTHLDAPTAARFADLASRLEPVFREVVALGWPGVPLILEQLQARSIEWAPAALRSITTIDPASSNARGDIEAERQAWLIWGREQGYFPDNHPEEIDEAEDARQRAEAERMTPSAERLRAIIARKLPVIGADLDADPANLD